MTLRLAALLALMTCAAVPVAAQAQAPSLQQLIGDPEDFTLTGSMRLRYETLDGQPRAGLRQEDEQLALRTILTADYQPDGLRLFAELHDSRAWLHQTGSPISANEVNTLELVQAHVGTTLALPRGGKATVQLGRMTLGLGSRRLVAADDYRNATNGYTGLRADVKLADGLAATAIYVLPHIRQPDDLPSIRAQAVGWDRESFDLQLWGGLVSRPRVLAGATLELGYFGLLERDWAGHPTRNRDLDTFSARLIRDPAAGRADFEVEGMVQTGSVRTGTGATAPQQAVSAWFVHADAGYSLPVASRLRLSVEYDRASGDAPGGTYGRFDTLFGMRGADLAQSGIYNAVGRANVSALGLRAEWPLVKRWEAYATWKALWLAERTDAFSTTGVRDPAGQSGNFAGNQVEVQVRYWLVPRFLRAQVNAVLLAKGRFLATAPNSPDSRDTRYIATTLSAHF